MDLNEELTAIRKAASEGKGKSERWFKDKVKSLGAVSPTTLMRSGFGKNVQDVQIGSMYLFGYFPKHHKTLPVYDIFPLVLPFSMTEDGFIGLNLHYIFPIVRIRLLQDLMRFRNTKSITEATKLRMSWEMLTSAASLKILEPTVHRYLWDHVRTGFLRISPVDWKTVVLLPLERFKKQGSRAVHQRSANRY